MSSFQLHFFRSVEVGFKSFSLTNRSEMQDIGSMNGTDLKEALKDFGRNRGANKCCFTPLHGSTTVRVWSVEYFRDSRSILCCLLNIESENRQYVACSDYEFTITF